MSTHGKPRLWQQAARFGVATGVGVALSLILPVLLREALGVAAPAAVAVGFAASFVANFVLHRTFVFNSRNDWARDAWRYLVTNGSLRLLEYGAFLVLHQGAGIHYAVSVFVVLSVSTVVKFFAYRRLFAG